MLLKDWISSLYVQILLVTTLVCAVSLSCQSGDPTPTVRPADTPTVQPLNTPTPTVRPADTPTVQPLDTPTPTVRPADTPTVQPLDTPTVQPPGSSFPMVPSLASAPAPLPTPTPTPISRDVAAAASSAGVALIVSESHKEEFSYRLNECGGVVPTRDWLVANVVPSVKLVFEEGRWHLKEGQSSWYFQMNLRYEAPLVYWEIHASERVVAEGVMAPNCGVAIDAVRELN